MPGSAGTGEAAGEAAPRRIPAPARGRARPSTPFGEVSQPERPLQVPAQAVPVPEQGGPQFAAQSVTMSLNFRPRSLQVRPAYYTQ